MLKSPQDAKRNVTYNQVFLPKAANVAFQILIAPKEPAFVTWIEIETLNGRNNYR